MALYFPGSDNLLGVLITWGIGAVLLLIGSAVAGRHAAPEFRIGAGWGAFCVALTLWGVFLPQSLRLPAIGVTVLALAAQLWPSRRLGRADAVALGRLLLVTLPLWAVVAPVRPSQVDTFLNLLPNADYLVDYARLPTAALPPSHSFLPAAPYDTQFLAFLGSLVWPDYPSAGMSLLNVMLRLVAGLAIARTLVCGAVPGWGATALGMLLVTLFDPGFVPRFDFSAYGETGLAVTTLLAACLFVEARTGRLRGIELSLILAAMINTKQSGIGLVLALAGAAFVTGVLEGGMRWGRLLGRIVGVLVPAALLYTVWRYFVAHAGVAELEPLPFGQWNWSLLPQIFVSIAASVAEKPVYFAAELAAFFGLALLLRRQSWSQTTRFLAFNAASFLLYNGFLVATYIAHFTPEMSAEAHSFFRYNTHLSLLLTLSLALAARDLTPALWANRRVVGVAAGVAVAIAVAAPLGFAERLRFDIEMPQPLVWDLAQALKPYLKDGDRLAVLQPGDDTEVGGLLGQYLWLAPPRRNGLDLLHLAHTDQGALDEAASKGYALAVVTCVPSGLLGLPAGEAALVKHDDAGWHKLGSWPYAAGPPLSHWQHNRHWPALCR